MYKDNLYLKKFDVRQIIYIFALEIGLLAEWLGNGLQNRVQRFDSARDLKKQLFYILFSLLKYS